jgi:hypothetical protein
MSDKDTQLLVPAMQKFYSALRSLDSFNKNQDFFDNISCLDNFLSEYRNVTFVIQKSLSQTDKLAAYKACCEKYFNTPFSKWFVEKRNEVLKEHPFELEKILKITIYDIESVTVIHSKIFSVKQDANFSDLKNELKVFLCSLEKLEVYFSVEYIFREKGKEDNLLEKLLEGIDVMSKFLSELNKTVEDHSELFFNLSQRIEKLSIMHVNKSLLLIDDYVYYVTTDSFEKGSRVELILPSVRIPMNSFERFISDIPKEALNGTTLYDWYMKTTALHIMFYRLQEKHILPTFILIYDDDTILMKSYNASLRTTTYRFIHEIAEKIKSDKGIKAVMYITEMWLYSSLDVLNKSYEERVTTGAPTSYLVSHLVTKEQELSVYVEEDKIDSQGYIKEVLVKGPKKENGVSFMTPIRLALHAH